MSETHLLENYDRYPITVDYGCGSYVFDLEGRRYLDLVSGLGANAFGYCHPRLTAVLVEQAGRCVHTSNLVCHRYQEMLAAELCRISDLDRVFFSNSGTEAMEAALKAVRMRAHPAKNRLVALRCSFHGRTLGSLSITGQPEIRRPFGPFGVEVDFVAPNDTAALERAIGDRTAALILEPVLGEGGVHPLTAAYLQQARELTSRFNALLIADETQSGLGRTGKYFAYQWAGIRPDIVTAAKPLAAGLPLGATLFTRETARLLPPHSHGSTFGGGPLACRVALEFLAMLEETLPGIEQVSRQFRQGLDCLKRRHSVITEVRSHGLMFGIQLSQPGRPLVDAALAKGLLINCTQTAVLRLLPPYNMQPAQIEEALEKLDDVLGARSAAHNSTRTARLLGAESR
ncbi:MAG: aspartate aminotransferase family protein [Terriglobia bacterium]|nr:MAG: aspartate aminotransferase family protein [Terriglobia bacterium]